MWCASEDMPNPAISPQTVAPRALARSSGSPGKTRLINFYRVNEAFYLADLPGFGYAKVGQEVRHDMAAALRAYFDAALSLRGVLYLVDIRVPDSPVDHAALEWILGREIPLLALAAKADKLNRSELAGALGEISRRHGLPEDPLPISSLKKTGLEKLWEQMEMLLA